MLKSGSMMIKDLLDCLQPQEWEEVSQSTPVEEGFTVHALVRDPVDRFISMLGEVIRRALLGECPEGKCDVKRDGFDHAALASMKAQVRCPTPTLPSVNTFTLTHVVCFVQPWYDSASYLINIPPNNTGARRHWLLRTVSAFLETSQCNLQYYGSEHSISQVQQLVSQVRVAQT